MTYKNIFRRTYKNIFRCTDYKLLADEKIILEQIMGKWCITKKQKAAIKGILNFLDAFEIEAVHNHNIPENKVWPYLKNEDL